MILTGGLHDHDFTHDHDTAHHHGSSATNSASEFTIISARSVLAFATLFSWAGTLYLSRGISTFWALCFSLLWGVAAMFIVSYVIYKLVKLQETGNISLWNCLENEGIVYMDIPQDGQGKIRVLVSDRVCFVNARSKDGAAIPAGKRVKVTDILENNTVEVQAIEGYSEGE